MSGYDTLATERDGDLLVVTLNRPERLNSASVELCAELTDALHTLEGARAVLITGAGRAFCAGADLQGAVDLPMTAGEKAHRSLARFYNPLLQTLVDLPVPLVAAVNGAAAGIGCAIALSADFVVAARSAYFVQAFVNVGLAPDGGSAWMLGRLVGKARAAQMLMLGERISADVAADWGLIYSAVENGALLDEARALAQRLATGPTIALGVARNGLTASLDGSFADALARDAIGQQVAGASNDAKEGRAAFSGKRPARFSGT